MACVRNNFAKDEEVTQTKVSSRCHIPHTTVRNRLHAIVDKPLGDGTKVVEMKIVRYGLMKDPPGKNEILDDSAETREGNDSSSPNFTTGLAIGAFAVSATVLFAFLVRRAIRKRHAEALTLEAPVLVFRRTQSPAEFSDPNAPFLA